MITKRNEHIDTTKGILMTLVIFGHVLLASKGLSVTGSFLLKLIYSFHMPAFLIISGILFNCENQKDKQFFIYLTSKVKHLLIPYFIFELLGGILRNIFAYGMREPIRTILKRVVTFKMYVGADWYLLTYFIASILLFILNKTKESRKVLPLIAALMFTVVGAFQYIEILEKPVFILRVMLAFSMIVLGITLKERIFVKNSKYIILAFAGLLYSVIKNPIVYMHSATIGSPLLFLVGCVSGTYLILQISAKVSSRLMNLIGANSIVPMGIHQNLIWIFGWFFGLSGQWKTVLLNFAFTYIVSIIVAILYARVFGKDRRVNKI